MQPEPQPIVVVSGLPRSGTSLLMQMLVAGGMQPVFDGVRASDEDNPRGYYELEAVKRLKTDSGWVADARGKVVKVISQLLCDLPSSFTYRLLLLRRDMDEVVRSQETMLRRAGRNPLPTERAKEVFAKHLVSLEVWLAKQPYITTLHVAHRDLISGPRTACQQIAEFLALPLELDAMVSAVDPTLYRNRHEPKSLE